MGKIKQQHIDCNPDSCIANSQNDGDYDPYFDEDQEDIDACNQTN